MGGFSLIVLGLTGPTGAGKSLASKYLLSLGYAGINLDDVGHDALEEHAEEIRRALISKIDLSQTEPLRQSLRKVVFKNPALLRELEKVTHPIIYTSCLAALKIASAEKRDLFWLDGFGLLSEPFRSLCDKIIFMTAPEALRVERIQKRTEQTKESVELTIKSQNEYFSKLSYESDDITVVENSGTLAELYEKLSAALPLS